MASAICENTEDRVKSYHSVLCQYSCMGNLLPLLLLYHLVAFTELQNGNCLSLVYVLNWTLVIFGGKSVQSVNIILLFWTVNVIKAVRTDFQMVIEIINQV